MESPLSMMLPPLLLLLLAAVTCAAATTTTVGIVRDERAAASHVYVRQLPAAATFGYSAHLYPFYTATLPYLQPVPPLTAIAELRSYGDVEGGGEIKGRITFVQPHPGGGPVFMSGNVTGLRPGKHAITVHTYGDTAQGCKSMGDHFNPHLANHGGPADPYRHVGDLGNLVAGDGGAADLQESDHVISLVGPESVVGRGLAVHALGDDLGRGGDMESLRTGNSGPAIACGIIAWAEPKIEPQQQPQPQQQQQQPKPKEE